LLVNYTVIGNGSNVRWSITFYGTQTKQSDIFSIFSVIYVWPFKQSINWTVTKTGWLCYQNVTKLSFASVQTANVRLQVAKCSQLRRLLSSYDPNHQRGVATSITVTMLAVQSHMINVTPTRCHTVAVHRRWGESLCERRPPLLSNAPRISS